MDEEKREQVRPLTYVAVVVPIWLQHALMMFLQSTPGLKLVACTATVQVLLALDLQPIPELIILETDKKYQRAEEQVKRLKAAWPASQIIALIPHQRLRASVQAAGAAEVLVSGTSPEQLRLAISRLQNINKDIPTDPIGDSKP